MEIVQSKTSRVTFYSVISTLCCSIKNLIHTTLWKNEKSTLTNILPFTFLKSIL